MTAFKIGDKVKVLIGFCKDNVGRVTALSNAPKGIGVNVVGSKIAIVWYKPDEIQKVLPEEEG